MAQGFRAILLDVPCGPRRVVSGVFVLVWRGKAVPGWHRNAAAVNRRGGSGVGVTPNAAPEL
jgi:hypothetical protein